MLGPILGPKANVCLLMFLHGVSRIISVARLDKNGCKWVCYWLHDPCSPATLTLVGVFIIEYIEDIKTVRS